MSLRSFARRYFSAGLKLIFLLVGLQVGQVYAEKVIVKIGLNSTQPPLVINNMEQSGLVYDIVDAMNHHQQDYQFEVSSIPIKRLMSQFKEYDIDIIAYNDVRWGWQERGGTPSIALTNGKDVFFTKRGSKHSNSNTIAAIAGFHYAFANYDPETLARMSNVSLADDEDGVLKLVMFDRVQRGIASKIYLNWLALSKPDVYKQLDIDWEHPDQEYHRQFVMLKRARIGTEAINQIILQLAAAGTLQEIYSRYGMALPAHLQVN